MSVDIEPSELGFQRPFTVEVSQILKIKNMHTTPIAFKVKTTAPKQYCVRPNSGRIEPGRDVEVSVLLQAMKQDPPLDAKCRDKFLVQSVAIPVDKDFSSVQEIWDSVEKSSIQERKIRVTFVPANAGPPDRSVSTPVRNSLANGVESTPEPPTTTFTSPKAELPAEHTPSVVQDRKASPEAKRDYKSEVEKNSSVAAAVASTVVSAKDTAVDMVKEIPEKLPQPEAVVESLKDASGLRQRKTGSTTAQASSGGGSGDLQQAVRRGTEGVPVHIVAILCLLCFLLGYAFF